MSKVLVGSQYFFAQYPNFRSKDIDEVEIVETDEFQHLKQISRKGSCLFIIRRQQSKDDYINWALESKAGMVLGKFLVPEFCHEIDFTVKDLLKLAPLLDRLDRRHQYERIIYDSYLSNEAFYLTEKQRDAAYASYCKSREAAASKR
jgi:hypothetical protein